MLENNSKTVRMTANTQNQFDFVRAEKSSLCRCIRKRYGIYCEYESSLWPQRGEA